MTDNFQRICGRQEKDLDKDTKIILEAIKFERVYLINYEELKYDIYCLISLLYKLYRYIMKTKTLILPAQLTLQRRHLRLQISFSSALTRRTWMSATQRRSSWKWRNRCKASPCKYWRAVTSSLLSELRWTAKMERLVFRRPLKWPRNHKLSYMRFTKTTRWILNLNVQGVP